MKRKPPKRRGSAADHARGPSRTNRSGSREQERAIVALSRDDALDRGDLRAAFRQIVRTAAKTANVRRVGIWQYGNGRLVLRCVVLYDLGRGRFARGEVLAATEYPAYFRALDSEVVIAATDAQKDRRTRELATPYLVRHGIRSMLDAPILVGGRLWGVLCHEAVGRRRRWSASHRLFARALADTAALAIEAAGRHAAAEALRRSEVYFRSLIENGSELVAVLGADGRLRYLSPATDTLLGYRPAALLGRTFFEFIHPHDVAGLTQAFQDLLAAPDRKVEFEARVRASGGSWRLLEGMASNQLANEAVGGIVVSCRDTTDRRWAELGVRTLLGVAQDIGDTLEAPALLRRVQRRTRQVLNAGFAATLLHGEDGTPRSLTTQSETSLSETRHEVLDRLARRLDQEVPPAGAFVVAGADQAAASIRALGFDSLAAVALVARGRRLGTLLLGRDSPERFESRELLLLEAIAKELASGLETARLYHQSREEGEFSAALLRVGYGLLAANDPSSLLERLCELTVEVLPCDFSRTYFVDEDEGRLRLVASHGDPPKQIEALRHLDLTREGIRAVLDRLERDEMVVDRELAARFGWKTVLLVALRERGRVIGFQTAGRRGGPEEFTARQRRLAGGIAQIGSLSLQNVLLVSRLEQANRVKSDFISMMSHELRTPLNIVLGYAGLLREGAFGALTDEQARVLERIDHGASGLLDLINTTLDLSQLERGTVAFQYSEVDFDRVLGEIETQCRALFDRPSVRLVCDVPAGLPPLRTDAGKLRVVLANLIANAFRFTDHGEIRVAVRPAREGLEIAISDTGTGIAAEAQSLIFEAFRQADTGPSRRTGGVGLGLYIVRRLLDLLHGSVEVESAVGKGSTFRIWIPLAPARDEPRARTDSTDATDRLG